MLYRVEKPQRCRWVVFRYPGKTGVDIAVGSWGDADGFMNPRSAAAVWHSSKRHRRQSAPRRSLKTGQSGSSRLQCRQSLQIIGVTKVASSQAMIAIPLPMER
jgi:hypothetical protein